MRSPRASSGVDAADFSMRTYAQSSLWETVVCRKERDALARGGRMGDKWPLNRGITFGVLVVEVSRLIWSRFAPMPGATISGPEFATTDRQMSRSDCCPLSSGRKRTMARNWAKNGQIYRCSSCCRCCYWRPLSDLNSIARMPHMQERDSSFIMMADDLSGGPERQPAQLSLAARSNRAQSLAA